ncbi:MAG: protein-L-isoaspartate(D-aspartate) O-methyltransferase [Anaerolineae bacterium]
MDRQEMINLIRRRGVEDERVLSAMATVPRHEFVPESRARSAYDDYAQPIGHQQTISQPYIVALMTEALDLEPGDKVLEIGTGSGYQAAVLDEMGMEVYTIERIPELYEEAKSRLERLGYTVRCKRADGFEGWRDRAPFDGIIVTAAAPEIPQPLIDQLADGGRMVIPVGRPGSFQTLWKIIKEDGQIQKIDLGGVAFVPFVSEDLGTKPRS